MIKARRFAGTLARQAGSIGPQSGKLKTMSGGPLVFVSRSDQRANPAS